jgi:signal transduction histidine kinase
MKKIKPRKYKNSLLSRYTLIIMTAIILVPIGLPASIVVNNLLQELLKLTHITNNEYYGDSIQLGNMWHEEAKKLDKASAETINQTLRNLKQKYSKASLFWVDSKGKTQLQLPVNPKLPDTWSAEQAIEFMKKRVNADPFTIISFIGNSDEYTHANQGFIVFMLPRNLLIVDDNYNEIFSSILYLISLLATIIAFIVVSFLFFRKIQKRLLRLEEAMKPTADNQLPAPIVEGSPDEIGRLEKSFNHMIEELEASQQREREEEALRKKIISNLSHDLRTPLTVLGGHLFTLSKESLSPSGKQSLALMESKINDLDGLIENLLSYNLLSSGKYKIELHEVDVIRFVRQSAAAWYPVWEAKNMEVHIDLPDTPLKWKIDELGFRRVLDNLFQNVIRYASTGRYIGISFIDKEGLPTLYIQDQGPGIETKATSQGSGLGLLIVDMLLKEMSLTREVNSTPHGTTVYISPQTQLLN